MAIVSLGEETRIKLTRLIITIMQANEHYCDDMNCYMHKVNVLHTHKDYKDKSVNLDDIDKAIKNSSMPWTIDKDKSITFDLGYSPIGKELLALACKSDSKINADLKREINIILASKSRIRINDYDYEINKLNLDEFNNMINSIDVKEISSSKPGNEVTIQGINFTPFNLDPWTYLEQDNDIKPYTFSGIASSVSITPYEPGIIERLVNKVRYALRALTRIRIKLYFDCLDD